MHVARSAVAVARVVVVVLALTLVSRAASGATAPSPLKLAPSKLSLGKEPLGTVGATSAPKLVTLTNKGTTPIAIASIALQGDFALAANGTTCGPGLAPGTSCALAVTFTPTALGVRAGALVIVDDAAGSPHVVPLKGAGVLGTLVLSPKSLAFPARAPGAAGAPQTLTIHNPNPVPIAITAVAVAGGDFSIASRTCGSVLGANIDCTVAVAFVPVTSGSRKGTLRVAAHAAKTPFAIKLKGKGLGKCNGLVPDLCGDTCTNVTVDPDNCGGCGNLCSGTCVDGRCENGSLECGGDTPNLCTCNATTRCTSFATDTDDCGGCGHACLVGQRCVAGTCVGCTAVNAPDECGTNCVDFSSDPLNCGGCGAACPSGLCVQGACLDCAIATPNACNGVCTNVLTDAGNCGGCGNVCPLGVNCVDGQCAGITCVGTTADACGNRCTNFQTDHANCGACGHDCGAGACVQGTCVACGGETPDRCGATCTDLASDDQNCGGCGNACPSGSTCSNGSCAGPVCPAAAVARDTAIDAGGVAGGIPCGADKPTLCGAECVDLHTDSFHCGTCDTFCPDGLCIAGSCAVGCAGETPNRCGGGCTDFFSDGGNCGGCGIGCSGGESCIRGVCQHGATCNGTATNTNVDPQNCGTCGHACPNGPCVEGECKQLQCTKGIPCNGKCVDPHTDPDNCGGCGNVCPAGLICAATAQAPDGGCTICSTPTPDDCNGLCTDLLTDNAHCGDCDQACPAGQHCDSGECGTCTSLYEGLPDLCGATCTSIASDRSNCGECGHGCAGNEYCFQGTCTKCGDGAPTQCGDSGNRCTNTQVDKLNCGGCAHACNNDEQCVDGKCRACAPPAAASSVAASSAAGGPPPPCCTGATPNACGTACVNFQTDSANCGGCGNSCGGNACTLGECDPGLCGTFKVTDWTGSVTETPSDQCGGSADLTLDSGITSTFTLTPSPKAPGACDVAGTLHLVQEGAICGGWGGAWICGGFANDGGGISLTCSCLTAMSVEGGLEDAAYDGSWSFEKSDKDDKGDLVTDSATGGFTLQRVSP